MILTLEKKFFLLQIKQYLKRLYAKDNWIKVYFKG
jgi:hypothetical protein